MDAIAHLGLKREDLFEQPPACPTDDSLTAHSYSLWYEATLQWQREGTQLFDLVRPTLDLSGPHADQDVRRLKGWKRDQTRDGRALVQWALSFVDRSSVEGQMELLKEISSMKLDPSETLFGLAEHLYKLWELWLDISSNDRSAPAAFLSQLLTSMPVSPEGPVVHVRRYLADMIHHKVSPMLHDIDGDNGLFNGMLEYGKMLGLQDVPRSSLLLMASPGQPTGGAPAGGGKNGDDPKNDLPKGDCNTCFAYACTKEVRGNDGCICKHTSKFDASQLTRQREKYVKLVRAYNKENPGKSLKVAIKVVREALDAKKDEQLTFMTSVESVMGSSIDNVDELEAWLTDNSGKAFFTLGHTGGQGDLQFVVEETEGYEAESESLAGSLHMMDASSGSAQSAASATDAEKEVVLLRAALEDANARVLALSTPTIAPAPSPSLAPVVTPTTNPLSCPTPSQRAPNAALDPPTALGLGSQTPKQAFNRWLASPLARAKQWTAQRQPKFTPTTGPIAEEGGAGAGGADGEKETATELICKGVASMESEKRKLRKKLKDKSASKWFVVRAIAKILLFWAGSVDLLFEKVYMHCWENMTLHQLTSLGLLITLLAPKLQPLMMKATGKLSKLMLAASLAQSKILAEQTRAAMAAVVSSLMTNAITTSAMRLGLTVTAPTNAPRTSDAAQAMPAPSTAPATAITAEGVNPDARVRPPADGDDDGTLMPLFALGGGNLGETVMLASSELNTCTGGKPALMDNGASNGTSCTRSLDGAVPGTYVGADAGAIGIGSEGASLTSKGSWIFVLERRGAKGVETVVRRMKYTPDLPMYMVFSEANENVEHGYSIIWNAGEQRTMVSPTGAVIHLFMSKSNLGWLQVIPVVDTVRQKAIMASATSGTGNGVVKPQGQLSVKMLDPAAVRTTGMGKLKPLRGVALVRRQHCVDGHPALPITVKNLKLAGAFDKNLVTVEHVKLFQEQGCASCETAKMRRRPFTIKVAPLDPTEPKVGKFWVFDVLELRVPDINSGCTLIYAAIEKVSGMALIGGMQGYSEANMASALNELRARVRPAHGDIHVIRADSHPTHRSASVRDYMLANQLHKQLSPPYVHEGVGKVENFFLISVPSANALLAAAPDLGENHFSQALAYVAHCRNFSVTSNSNPPRSPGMVYFDVKDYRAPGLQVFGAAANALVHGEARDSKFDDHARPCIYMGPAVNSDSAAHCAVFFDKRYLDVDVGCIVVDEHVVLERTRRDHPDAQPYNQVGGAKTVDVGRPTSLFDLSGFRYSVDDLPRVQPIIWVRHSPLPTEFAVLLLWHGELRPGDMSSWVHELGAHKVLPIPIDIKIGGQEHNLARKPVKDAVVRLLQHDTTLGAFLQPECSPFSVARHKRPGPPVLFDAANVDGIPDEDGEVPAEVMQALATVRLVAEIFRASAGTDKVVGLEYPASQGRGSPFAAAGRETHSTIADTTIMSAVAQELRLEVIYSEQGAAGASTRKPTAMLATPALAAALARTVGTLVTSPGEQVTSIVGMNEAGQYRSHSSEVYTPEYAMRITIALLGSMPTVLDLLATHAVSAASGASTEDLFPVGTDIEVYWYGERTWFKGVVLDSDVRKGKVHGNVVNRREIKVRYHSDNEVMWHALSDCTVREVQAEEPDAPTGGDAEAVVMLLEARPKIALDRANGGDFLVNLLDEDATPQWETNDDGDALSALPTMLGSDYVKPVTEAVSRLFDDPAPMVHPPLMGSFTRLSVCAMAIAKLLVSKWRVGTRFKLDSDETLACNAERRIIELVHHLAQCRDYDGRRGVQEAVDELLHEYTPAQRREMGVSTADDLESEVGERALADALLAAHFGLDEVSGPNPHQVAPAANDLESEIGERALADALLASHFGTDEVDSPDLSQVAPPPPPPPPPLPGSTYRLDAALFGKSMTKEGQQQSMLNAHVGEVLTARDVAIDIETHDVVSNSAVFAVLDTATVQKIDTSQAHKWHCPTNERDYNRSPQRALWRTAKELKMDEYQKIPMFDLVKRSDVDESKHTIYKTLWAYKIKFEEGGLVFSKLNPRWCVKGGTMDRDVFKSYAEMMRSSSMNIGWGLKSAFYDQLIDALLDLSNAFQSTTTVDKDGNQLEGEPEFYTEQAPGFKKYGKNGEELVCKQRCYMQGRIDATAGFDRALHKILVEECGMTPLLWDSKVYIFNTTKYVGTATSLHDIIEEATRVVADGGDSGPQQVPIGWAWFGQHVDDLQTLATGLQCRETNRILLFVRGTIASTYACKYTGWHGNKCLGFGMTLCDKNKTVAINALGALQAIRARLFSKADFKTTPRHIVTEAVYEKDPGDVPAEGDPLRADYLSCQALVRSVLGASIWIGQAYPQVTSGINAMCVDMANPGLARLGQLRHMFMHLGENPSGKIFGGPNVTSIGGDGPDVAPFTAGQKEGRYHYFSDASINVTGGVGMFSGCCIQNFCLRQHLQAPCAHTSELVAAGSNIHALVLVTGVLQEIGLLHGRPTTIYFDSISTVFVSTSDAAPKKSAWLARRTKVVTEAVEQGEAKPVHIKESDMIADSCTKYIKRDTWMRHMHYVLNLPGDPPNCYEINTKLNAA